MLNITIIRKGTSNLIPTGMATVKQTNKQKLVSVSETMDKLKLCALLVGMYNGTAIMEDSMETA